MSNVTRVVISTVNWIRANALNHRKFKKLLVDVDADYSDLYDLIPEIKTFVEEKKGISQLGNEERVADLAFMVNVTQGRIKAGADGAAAPGPPKNRPNTIPSQRSLKSYSYDHFQKIVKV